MADGIELDIESSALKFTAYMTLETAARLDDGTVNWGILVAPEMYFEQLDTEKTGQVDWVPAFEESELASMKRAHMALSVIDDPRDSGEKVCRIEYNVGTGFQNYNGEFTAIGYIETVTDEGTTYEYASYPKGGDVCDVREVVQLSGGGSIEPPRGGAGVLPRRRIWRRCTGSSTARWMRRTEKRRKRKTEASLP